MKNLKSVGFVKKRFFLDDKNRKVRDHCHLTGKYRETAHAYCNLQLSVTGQNGHPGCVP